MLISQLPATSSRIKDVSGRKLFKFQAHLEFLLPDLVLMFLHCLISSLRTLNRCLKIHFCLAFLFILIEKKDPDYLVNIPGRHSQTWGNARQYM